MRDGDPSGFEQAPECCHEWLNRRQFAPPERQNLCRGTESGSGSEIWVTGSREGQKIGEPIERESGLYDSALKGVTPS